jgi:hypothetical protein
MDNTRSLDRACNSVQDATAILGIDGNLGIVNSATYRFHGVLSGSNPTLSANLTSHHIALFLRSTGQIPPQFDSESVASGHDAPRSPANGSYLGKFGEFLGKPQIASNP